MPRTNTVPDKPGRNERTKPADDAKKTTLDETIESTFPASDPPSTIPDPDTGRREPETGEPLAPPGHQRS
jgi:hypothetical protein